MKKTENSSYIEVVAPPTEERLVDSGESTSPGSFGVPEASLRFAFNDYQPVAYDNSLPRYKKKTTSKKRTLEDLNDLEPSKTFIPDSFLPESEIPAENPSDNEDFDSVRESLNIVRLDESTNVVAIVVDKKDESNVVFAIKCSGGIAFGGYAYDTSRDSYLVHCVECIQIGQLSFSFAMTMPNVGKWQVKVPIPESVLNKHFSPVQRKAIERLREAFPSERFSIQFIQMLGCN